jgi:hypothetical protein
VGGADIAELVARHGAAEIVGEMGEGFFIHGRVHGIGFLTFSFLYSSLRVTLREIYPLGFGAPSRRHGRPPGAASRAALAAAEPRFRWGF